MSPTAADRFWGKVDQSGGPASCWIWTAARDGSGYGMIRLKHPDGWVTRRAHRFAWELEFGPIPNGLLVCHTCDIPPCCNSSHLFLDTLQGNMNDRNAKGRQAHGMGNGRAVLTENQVREMRQLREEGLLLRELAERFRVSLTVVRNVTSRKSWAHVDDR